jgi:cytochrome bd ubiquinol oxidase subunit II
VLAAIGLFGGFPLAFSTLLPALYLPITIMLLALIVRGVSIEYQLQSESYAPGWGSVFAIGSLVAALCQGVVVGAVISGIPVANRHFAGGPLAFVHPFCILTAAWLVSTYLLVGAGWLNDKALGELQAWSKQVLRHGAGPAALLAAATLVLGFMASPVAAHALSPRPLAILAAAIAAGGLFWAGANAAGGTRDSRPFVFTELALLSAALGLTASIYPYLVPPAVTFWEAAAPRSSVDFLLIAVASCMPIVLAYNAYASHVFRGKFVVPVPAALTAIAPPRRTRRSVGSAPAAVDQPAVATDRESVTPLAWLRNAGWIAVGSVLYVFCSRGFNRQIGNLGTFVGILLLVAAMVTVWIVTERRDLAR